MEVNAKAKGIKCEKQARKKERKKERKLRRELSDADLVDAI